MSRAWTLTSMFVVFGWTAGATAQDNGAKLLPPAIKSSPPTPLGPTFHPRDALKGPIDPANSQAADPTLQANVLPVPIAFAGTAISPASQGAGAGTTTVGFPQFPVILPGLLTATMPESARPMDRVFFSHSHLDRFRINRTQLNAGVPLGTTLRDAGFNLNTYIVGIEKTFFNGMLSAYTRLPVLDATGNTSGQPLDGVGDVNFGMKIVLWESPQRNHLFTSGITVTAPTGRRVDIPVEVRDVTYPGGGLVTSTGATSFVFRRLNPTYLQPWLAAQLTFDRLFIHDYFGVIIPTQNEVATFINHNVTLGYQVYRGDPGRILRSVTSTADIHMLFPVTRRGEPVSVAETGGFDSAALPPATFGFSDQLFLTGGTHVGLGNRTLFSFGITSPITGPRAYTMSYSLGVSYFY